PVTLSRLSSRRSSDKSKKRWALSSWETWRWEASKSRRWSCEDLSVSSVRVEFETALTSSTKSRSSRETSKSRGWCANTSSRALFIISQNFPVPSIIIDIPLIQQEHL